MSKRRPLNDPTNPQSVGGKSRAQKLSARRRHEIAMKGAMASMKKAGIAPVGTEGDPAAHELRRALRRDAREESQQLEDEEQLLLDPVGWQRQFIRNPDTRQPFELYKEEEVFLREAFTPDPKTLRLKYDTVVFGAPKKSGKTALASMALLYVIMVLGGASAEGYVVSNSREQAGDRVFADCVKILKASPRLIDSANPRTDTIEFPGMGSFIKTVTTEAKSAAGPRPTIVVGDEIWGFTSEAAARLWDEMAPTPTNPVSVRLIVTYAGFVGESVLLERIYHRIFDDAGNLQEGVRQIGTDLYAKGRTLMYWTHECRAPWQTPEWIETMRTEYTPNQFARIMENRWVSAESSFIDAGSYDRCVSKQLQRVKKAPHLHVWSAVDASISKDTTAIVTVALDAVEISEEKTWLDEVRSSPHYHPNPLVDLVAALPWRQDYDDSVKPATLQDLRVKVVDHKIIEARRGGQVDFSAVENYILGLQRRFRLDACCYDPFQMVAVAQALMQLGVPMIELAQTQNRTIEFSGLLRDLISQERLRVYDAPEIRSHVLNAVAKESPRGSHIVKRTRGAKIDLAVALAMACLGCARSFTLDDPQDKPSAPVGDIYAV